MGLKEKLMEDLKNAMKSKDDVRVRTIRMIISAIKNAEVEKMGELGDPEILKILQREAKKRKEAIELYRKGGREDLARSEEEELKVIESYMPEQMTDDEIESLAKDVIKELGASSLKNMGAVMKEMMKRVAGRADGRKVNEIVRNLLKG